MSIAAVAVLQTIARNEFERDCHDSEDYDWVNGQPWFEPPTPGVPETVVELEGKTYTFATADIVAEIKQWEEYYGYEAQDEIDEMPEEERYGWGFDEDEVLAEKTEEKLHRHFFDQLDNAQEALAAFQARADYLTEHLKELVAYFQMIGERIPELRPHLEEQLEALRAYVNEVCQKWIDECQGADQAE